MNTLAREFEGRARFVVVEADRDGQVLESFDASSFPAYIVYRDGVEITRLTLSFASIFMEERLRAMVDRALE